MTLKLLKELSKTPKARLSLREISRILNINAMAVSRAVKRLEPILDVKSGSNFESFKLQVKLVRLREGFEKLTEEDLLKKVKFGEEMGKGFYGR